MDRHASESDFDCRPIAKYAREARVEAQWVDYHHLGFTPQLPGFFAARSDSRHHRGTAPHIKDEVGSRTQGSEQRQYPGECQPGRGRYDRALDPKEIGWLLPKTPECAERVLFCNAAS